MNPTSEVRSQRLTATNQRAAVAPSIIQSQSTAIAKRESQHGSQSPLVNHMATDKANLVKGQHQVASSQVAQQALVEVSKTLQQMKKVLVKALSGSQLALPETAEKLNHYQADVSQKLSSATYGGRRVLSSSLDLVFEPDATHSFTIPGLDLNRQRGQSEMIRLDLSTLGSVVINLDATKSDQQIVASVDRALIPFGIRASAGEAGRLLFKTNDEPFNQIAENLMVTGQGHRYPAGQPNPVQLQSEPVGVEDQLITLSNRDSIREALSDVNGHLRRVQESYDNSKAYQHRIAEAFEATYQQKGVTDSLSDLSESLTSVAGIKDSFANAYQAYAAQANVHRHTVVALLK